MSMEPNLIFFIGYLAIFRFSIIAVGMICIFLGYRMFQKGGFPEKAGGESDVEGKVGDYAFKMTNVAPGAFFALFGAVIISVMLAKSPPEISVKFLEPDASVQTAARSSQPAPQTVSQFGIRGDGTDELSEKTGLGAKFEQQGDLENAAIAYKAAISVMALPMNNLAGIYHRQGKYPEALSISRQAAAMCPDNANYLDTLADILFSMGEKTEAVQVMEKAAGIDPKFRDKLKKFKGD